MTQFPLKTKVPPYDGAAGEERVFSARRANGRRHAGCDLWAALGTPVYPIAKGVVVRSASFDRGTWQIEVHHEALGVVVRYTELLGAATYATKQAQIVAAYRASGVEPDGRIAIRSFNKGDEVEMTDILGGVGYYAGARSPMLHFELYDERIADEPMTERVNVPYQRNRALLDPTDFLKALQAGEPPAPGKKPSLWERSAVVPMPTRAVTSSPTSRLGRTPKST